MPITRLHSSSDLREKFRACGRQSTFSTQAFDWLWDYLCEYEDSTDTPLEVDVIGLCCYYTEEDYDSIASLFSIELPDQSDFVDYDPRVIGTNEDGTPAIETYMVPDVHAYEEAKREAILDYLNDHTVVLGYDDDSVLFAAF